MTTFHLMSSIAVWLLVLFVGFLLLGTLRSMGLLRWQLEQLQALTSPPATVTYQVPQ